MHNMCRACCRVKCYTEGLDCPGHRILVKTKREKAAIYYGQLAKRKEEEEEQEKVKQASGQSDEVQKGCEKNGVESPKDGKEEGEKEKENAKETDIENGYGNGTKKENGGFDSEESKKTEPEDAAKHQPLQDLPQEAQAVQSNTCNT